MEIAQAYRQIPACGKAEDLALVANAGEGNLRMCHGQDLDLLQNPGGLGLIAPQELAARGHVEKKIGDLDPRSRCLSRVTDSRDLASCDLDLRSGSILPATRGEPEPGDACNAGKGFASEPQRADGGKIRALTDLTRGMALQTQKRVGTVHAVAIVGDTDHAGATAKKLHGDAACPGVDGILDEFLDHGGRALHDLAGSHLAGHDIGEKLDAAHGSEG